MTPTTTTDDLSADRLHLQEARAQSMQVLCLALAIADEAVRSDIEVYAKGIPHPEGYVVYDLRFAEITGKTDDAEQAHAVTTAQRAARYIDLCGDRFRWRMVRVGADHLVRFVDKGSSDGQ